MKTLIGLVCLGILAGVWVESRTPGEAEAVVTVGGIEAPLPPPRVRVRNFHDRTVAVSYRIVADGELHPLGTVPVLAAMTFPLPERLGAVRIVVEAEGTGERFTSRQIACAADTDVDLEVVWPIGASKLEVARLGVVGALSRPLPGDVRMTPK